MSISFYVGIDIANETFAVTILSTPKHPLTTKDNFHNNLDSFPKFLKWLAENNVSNKNSIICMEATGVYSEALAYYLFSKKFKVAVEPPLKVKRAFKPTGHKTDPVDSKQIAEYAFRFIDQVHQWQPKAEILEKIKHLLVAREQLVKKTTALKNELSSYCKHIIQVDLITNSQKELIKIIQDKITKITHEIECLLKKDLDIHHKATILMSICGVGMLLSANFLVSTHAFEKINDYKILSSFYGIAPFQYQSGTSVWKKSKSRKFGPPIARKLLRLAAQSLSTHNPKFVLYKLRKQKEGKSNAVIFNNISNKILKISCALIKQKTHFIKNHQSINPMFLCAS